jgi:hypothetical protein
VIPGDSGFFMTGFFTVKNTQFYKVQENPRMSLMNCSPH